MRPDKLGPEAKRTYLMYQNNGFFKQFMSGQGLDIGFKGSLVDAVPILDTAIGVDIDYPNYINNILPFPTESQDYVHSSHCLEHISDYKTAIKEWFRVLKVNGYLIIMVPHKYLYERKDSPPSNWNADHKRFYTPSSLLLEIETSLTPNTYRIRMLHDGDKDYDYNIPNTQHCSGQCEIILVIEKIAKV